MEERGILQETALHPEGLRNEAAAIIGILETRTRKLAIPRPTDLPDVDVAGIDEACAKVVV